MFKPSLSYRFFIDVIRVKWDSGDTNIYMQSDEANNYDLRKVDEPRKLVDEMIAVGCRVVRGMYLIH